MNIVIIPAFFQTKQRKTLGSFFLDQAIALKRAGHRVTILYSDTYSVKCVGEWLNYEELSHTQIQGVEVFRAKYFCPFKHGIEGHKETFAKGIIKLWNKYMVNESVDIIHAHCCVWAGYAAMKLSHKTGVPYVVTEHATLFQLHKDTISDANDKIIKQVFRSASKVICVSKAFAELLNEYTQNIEIIGNVIDCEQFKIRNSVEADKGSNVEFLTVCYMEEEAQLYKKGLDILIKAWAKVVSRYPNARLIIGGGGKAKEKVVEWTREYQVAESVTFLGALERNNVVQQMQSCDCFVLPSRYETFGVVYIEAMACGKPVIAVANGGPDDFVNEFNGILIQPENEQELIEALTKMIEEISGKTEKYQADKIASYVEEKFSYQAIANQLEKLYSTLVR